MNDRRVTAWLIALALPTSIARAEEPPRVDFARDVQPILAERCLLCHGPDENDRKAGLRLDTEDGLRASLGDGIDLIVPGHPDESELIFRAEVDDDTLRMPPPESGKPPLTDDQIETLRRWIAQGAEWSAHWAFRVPTRPALPDVSDPAWCREPIDRFVLARLEREGLRPAPEADRATLIRRLSLDLLGLPPSPEEIDAFVADPAPDAYERMVDRLLDSPHYGERWGRRWLDLARYADTNGYEKDRDRSIWPYRDWVIHALNADLPFDRFTIEQIAGDLLPDATTDQLVATGFHRNTMINEEGGIDVEEFRYAALVDRVMTTGTTWLGLTIGCAQCHTHKYDPITQREYYGLFAFLNNADEPEIEVPDPIIAARRAAMEAEVAARVADLPSQFPLPEDTDPALTTEENRRVHLDVRQTAWEAGLATADWTILRPTRVDSRKHATMETLEDASVLVSGDKPNNDVYEVELTTDLAGVTALRLEVLPHGSLPDGGPGRAPLFSVGDFLLTEVELSAAPVEDPEAAGPVKIARATEDHCEKGHPAALAIDGVPDTGWTVKGGIGQPHAAVFELAEPIGDGRPMRLSLVLHQEYIHQMTIGRFRVSVTTDPAPVRASGVPDEVERAVRVPARERCEVEAALVRRQFLDVAPELAEARQAIANLRESMPMQPTSMVMSERRPEHARTTHMHNRGEFLQPTEPVAPDVPQVLHGLPAGAPRDRLTLARWLVADDNPLVGRVVMNRVWAAYFGRGIVATLEDFGARGERPSHPELLDWLAVEFRESGWSLKAMHRQIVKSATYRQDSRVNPDLLALDPDNRLLARGPRTRVEAEVVRDLALAAAGLLDARIGGPSVYPPQPEGVTALAYGGPGWPTSDGRDRYRRGLYTFLKRTAPYASFITFDAPTSDTSCARRERSNTPLQALTLLNDPVFVDVFRALARRVLAEVPARDGNEARAQRAFRLLLGREPDASEVAAVVAFLDAQAERFRSEDLDARQVGGTTDEERDLDPVELAAWTTVARALMNLDETITKE